MLVDTLMVSTRYMLIWVVSVTGELCRASKLQEVQCSRMVPISRKQMWLDGKTDYVHLSSLTQTCLQWWSLSCMHMCMHIRCKHVRFTMELLASSLDLIRHALQQPTGAYINDWNRYVVCIYFCSTTMTVRLHRNSLCNKFTQPSTAVIHMSNWTHFITSQMCYVTITFGLKG